MGARVNNRLRDTRQFCLDAATLIRAPRTCSSPPSTPSPPAGRLGPGFTETEHSPSSIPRRDVPHKLTRARQEQQTTHMRWLLDDLVGVELECIAPLRIEPAFRQKHSHRLDSVLHAMIRCDRDGMSQAWRGAALSVRTRLRAVKHPFEQVALGSRHCRIHDQCQN
jgi:hypothetical protein